MPASPLLKTKLSLPANRQPVVRRARLVERLEQGADLPLTLLSAPAGFGKTTLLAEWANQAALPVAWLSLDDGENDPQQFVSYLIGALARLPKIDGELDQLQPSSPAPIQSVLEKLIEQLETLEQPFFLVLDDYHEITSPAVHGAMVFLLDHLPASVHLVIASRTDPPFPLGRRRARRELIELRAADLRFTSEEAAAFLNEQMGLALTPGEIETLEARTEGWVAGLQLAALSMLGRPDREQFIQAFSGSNRFVLDYLAEEVVNRQPEVVQKFLLHTSILERFTGPLCDAVTKATGGQALLAQIEKANLFLIPLDDERSWYRYHHLFADLLQVQLKLSEPQLIAVLHRRAAEWFEQNGYIHEALQYLDASQDYERAADLIERYGQEAWSASDLYFMTVANKLPEEIIRARPRLLIFRIWMMVMLGQVQAAQSGLDILEKQLAKDPSNSDLKDLAGFSRLLAAYLIAIHGQSYRGEFPDSQALEFVPEKHLGMRNSAEVIYAMLLAWRSDFKAMEPLLLRTVQRDLAAGGTTATPIAISLLARMLVLQGRLHAAIELCQEYLKPVMERGQWRFYIAGNLNISLGEALLEWNDLPRAEEQIRAGIAANEPWKMPGAEAAGKIALARLQYAHGQIEAGLETLASVEGMVRSRQLQPEQVSHWRGLKAQLYLAQGNLKAAQALVDEFDPQGKAEFILEPENITQARVLIAQQEYSKASQMLESLARAARAGGRLGRLVEILFLLSLAQFANRKKQEAFQSLANSLVLAEGEGFLRVFLEEGEPAHHLLANSLPALPENLVSYARRVLAAFPPSGRKERSSITPELIEPITARELEVLMLVCEGATNQEIAGRLFITVSAVKKHIGNIFGKLGVQNRTQAVLRSRALGLMTSKE